MTTTMKNASLAALNLNFSAGEYVPIDERDLPTKQAGPLKLDTSIKDKSDKSTESSKSQEGDTGKSKFPEQPKKVAGKGVEDLYGDLKRCNVDQFELGPYEKMLSVCSKRITSGLDPESKNPLSALEAVSSLSKLIKTSEAAIKNIMLKANSEFALKLNETQSKTMCVDNVTYKIYSKPATYVFTDAVTELASELKKTKAYEKKSGVATKVPAVINPSTDKIFAITVLV